MARFLPGASPTRRSGLGHAASQGRKAAACRFIDECLEPQVDRSRLRRSARYLHGLIEELGIDVQRRSHA